jgi:hypothetical protein
MVTLSFRIPSSDLGFKLIVYNFNEMNLNVN